MNQSITPQQTAAIKEYIDTHRDEIVAVYLYGSEAEGVANTRSDIDLAVLLREPCERSPFDIQLTLTVAFQRLFDREIDVHVLTSETGLPFLEEVLRYKQLVAVNDDDYRMEFEYKAFQRIIDFRPVLQEYLAAMRDRLQKGTYASR